MDKKEIINRISDIKKGLDEDNCAIIKDKAGKRELNIFQPNKLLLLRKLIAKVRRRFAVEINHVLDPVLENQKEINLRLLKELEALKEENKLLRTELNNNKNGRTNKKTDLKGEK